MHETVPMGRNVFGDGHAGRSSVGARSFPERLHVAYCSSLHRRLKSGNAAFAFSTYSKGNTRRMR